MNETVIRTPGGEELVLLSRADYDALCDKADAFQHGRILAQIEGGQQESLTADEVRAALGEPTPLAFWRKRRGLTQSSLAKAAGISQSYLASLEKGARRGEPGLFKALAEALRVRMEDLI